MQPVAAAIRCLSSPPLFLILRYRLPDDVVALGVSKHTLLLASSNPSAYSGIGERKFRPASPRTRKPIRQERRSYQRLRRIRSWVSTSGTYRTRVGCIPDGLLRRHSRGGYRTVTSLTPRKRSWERWFTGKGNIFWVWRTKSQRSSCWPGGKSRTKSGWK